MLCSSLSKHTVSCSHCHCPTAAKSRNRCTRLSLPQSALLQPFRTRQAGRQRLSQRRTRSVTAAKPNELEGDLVSSNGVRYGVVVARFNDLVTKLLLDGCLDTFKRHGASREDIDVAWVPGSFELPVVAKAMAKSNNYGAVVAIGVIVRGATAHYDAVVNAATSGCLGASTSTGVPVIFGVLTTDDMDQALDRAGGKVGNKGGEAAATAIEMANLMADMHQKGIAAKPW